MEIPEIFESEYRFCEILWEHEPVLSSALVGLCRDKLGWKKSTTYTVIKRLSQRGIVKSKNAVVTALVSREEVQSARSREFVEKNFSGSLPGFIAAFTQKCKVSKQDAAEISRMLDEALAREEKK